jgi:hypothetical protein
MARQVAFAMQLPLISEEQERGLRRYGSEKCEEIRIVKRDDGVVFAGILISAFKSKKVAQCSFATNLKAWQIPPPKYLRNWYRELSKDEYFAEFGEESRVLGRRLQDVVGSTVQRLIDIGMQAVSVRDAAVATKVEAVRQRKAQARQNMDRRGLRSLQEIFNVFAHTILERRRETDAMMRADGEARRVAQFQVLEEKRQADLAYTERLKCPEFRAQLELEKIQREKELSARCVAHFYEMHPEKKRRVT